MTDKQLLKLLKVFRKEVKNEMRQSVLLKTINKHIKELSK